MKSELNWGPTLAKSPEEWGFRLTDSQPRSDVKTLNAGRADLAHYSHTNRNKRGSDLRKAAVPKAWNAQARRRQLCEDVEIWTSAARETGEGDSGLTPLVTMFSGARVSYDIPRIPLCQSKMTDRKSN